jgi:hypothetical protein
MATSALSVSVAVAHAVAYLTRPLILSQSATTVIKLQLVLEANLTALFTPTWVPKEPLRGSGRRCLTLSPNCLPPRAVYAACLAAGVQWFDWIALLGGRELDFFVDPGHISVRYGKGGQLVTIWSDELTNTTSAKSDTVADEPFIQTQLRGQAAARAKAQVSSRLERKTLAQQLLEEDGEEDDQLFAMIADEVAAPTWMTPVLDKFPTPPRSVSPLSAISSHSRSSSCSSNSSSGLSFTSADTFDSTTTFSSTASKPVAESKQGFKLSRRERARQAKVFVDTSKTEVTPYDGGKTTVLTGGVMLGGGPKPARKAAAPTFQTTTSWRVTRA